MVLVAVGEEDRQQLPLRLQQVGDVGDDQVDPEHVLLREHEAGVDYQDLALVLERPHVDADLAKAAQRDVANDAHSKGNCSVVAASPAGRGRAGRGPGGWAGASTLSRYSLTRSKSPWSSLTNPPLWSAAAG